MSPFKIEHDYNPKKPIDFIPMTHQPRVSELASTFASHIHNLHKKSVKKFRKAMLSINLMLICTVGTLNLKRVIM